MVTVINVISVFDQGKFSYRTASLLVTYGFIFTERNELSVVLITILLDKKINESMKSADFTWYKTDKIKQLGPCPWRVDIFVQRE